MHLRELQLQLQRCETLAILKKAQALALTLGLLNANQPLACKILNGYIKLGSPQEALKVFFNHIEDPDVVSWTCLIHLYLQFQRPYTALATFSLLLRSGVRPDSFSIVGALSACGRSKNLPSGRALHGTVLKSGSGYEPIVGNALIDMYSRNSEIAAAQAVFGGMRMKDVSSWTSLLNGFIICRDIESAHLVFDEMPLRNEVSWTAMISGCVQGEMPIRALELFKEMNDEGLAYLTEMTLVAVLSGCADIGAFHLGVCIHSYVSKIGMTNNVTVKNALLDMYSKSGSLGLAHRLFNEMQSRDVFSWTTMISAYAFHGEGSTALELFYAMLESGINPNEVTFVSVLSACSHAGLVLEGWQIFSRMTELYGIGPKIEHLGCMVDLLGRAGLLEEAQEFIEQMTMNPDAVIWRSFLSACIFHGNLNLAEVGGKKVMELEPEDNGVLVLLWNLHCATINWEGAGRMRKMMRDKKVKKKPGCSWVEINGVAHEFLAEDVTHHYGGEMCLVVEEILETMKFHMNMSHME